jgi:hypothetical protein
MEINLNINYSIDLIKPSVIYKYIKPILISINLFKLSLKKRPITKD